MTENVAPHESRQPISRIELVSLLAMLTATLAFSIDAMLPALPDISADLNPTDPNRAQLVLTSLVIGLGLGTLFAGPLCDAFGRKKIAVTGALIYTLSALAGALSQNLEFLLIARFAQGVGASGPRVAVMAIVRDLFSGRQMAQIMSYIVFVFSLTPVIAPTIGWAIAEAFGWRAIFYSFAIFSVVSMTWLLLRQPETLLPENTRAFQIGKLIEGTIEVLSNRQVVLAMLGQALIYSVLFSTLMSSQQIFDVSFGRGDEFPLWFGAMALLSASSSLMNAKVVMRLGMQLVVRRALIVHGAFTLVFLTVQVTGLIQGNAMFAMAFLWLSSNFFLAGFGLGNMNALSLEPLGHMAGLATSIVTAFATIASALISVPIGLSFDGTPVPLTLGALILVILAFLAVRQIDNIGTAA